MWTIPTGWYVGPSGHTNFQPEWLAMIDVGIPYQVPTITIPGVGQPKAHEAYDATRNRSPEPVVQNKYKHIQG
jgi:hypothetical protein